MGIVNRVVAAREADGDAVQFAETICKNGPLAVRPSRNACTGTPVPLKEAFEDGARLLGEGLHDEDAQEGSPPSARAPRRLEGK